jgi:hypothetical protein
MKDDDAQMACDHGIVFDEDEARKVLGAWAPTSDVDFIVGNPKTAEIRKRWPRLDGPCPKGCGFVGIGYASYLHYIMGDY